MAEAVELILVPYDSSVPHRRMGRGPHALIEAGLPARLEREGVACRLREVEPEDDFLAEIATAFDLHRGVRRAVEDCRRDGCLPITLSGNCNTGVIGSMAAGQSQDLGLFWFDAHSDAETPESSTSGFLDGMGLAMTLGRCWQPMLEAVGAPGLDGRRAALVGAREVSAAAATLLRESGIAVIPPDEARNRNPEDVLALAVTQMRAVGVRRVHVHLDLDVLDPELVGPANEFALENGLTSEQLQRLLQRITTDFETASVSVASYDPHVDRNGTVAAAGLEAIALLTKT